MNFLAVLVAAVLYMLIGSAWYSPALFGKRWLRALGWSQKDFEKRKQGMGAVYGAMFVTALVLSSALAVVLGVTGTNSVGDGVLLAGLLWLGFVVTVGFTTVLFEHRSTTVFFISAGYHLVAMVVMAALLAIWP